MHPRQAAAGSSSSAKPSPRARAVTSPRLAAAGDVAARDAPGRRDRRTRAREGKALERRDQGRPITCRSDSLTGRAGRLASCGARAHVKTATVVGTGATGRPAWIDMICRRARS